METLNSLVEKINKKIKNGYFFFISNEIEHGTGLETFINNFFSICLKNTDTVDYLKKNSKKVFCLKKQYSNTKIKTSAQILEFLLSNPKQKNLPLNWKNKKIFLQTFKISSKFERLASKINAKIINTPAKLNRKFEHKISQSKILIKNKINIPKTQISILKDCDYKNLVNEFGKPFVIQFNRGHTGQGTIFITSEKKLIKLKETFPKRTIRILKFIPGQTYSANCCMTSKGIFVGGIYKQITGISELTAKPGATVGGTWIHGLSTENLKQFKNELSKLAKVFKIKGYQGLFGIDFIIEKNTSKVKIIEINARQQMTVAFNSRLNILQNLIPLNLIHIAEFLNINIKLNPSEHNQISMQEFKAGQLYLRNKSNSQIKIKKEKSTGEYKINSLNKKNFKFIKKEYRIDRIDSKNLLLLTRKLGEKIKTGNEIARIQVLDNLLNKKNKVKNHYVNFLLRQIAD